MSHRNILVFALAVVSSAAHAGLVGHWKLNESGGLIANDSSGFGNHGALSGSVNFVAGGAQGNCALFNNANNGIIRMGNVHGMTSGSFTLSAWILTDNTMYQLVAGKHDSGYFNGYFLATGSGSGYGGAGKGSLYMSNAPGAEPISTTSVLGGPWKLLTGVYDAAAGQARIYVNGVLENSRSVWPIGANSRDWAIGGNYHFSGYTGSFNGFIDDVQLYNMALTDNEVGYLYHNPGSPVPEPTTMTAIGIGIVAILRRKKVN